jgi:hypothetical protein
VQLSIAYQHLLHAHGQLVCSKACVQQSLCAAKLVCSKACVQQSDGYGCCVVAVLLL